MELNQIRCFLALSETLNFTRAAERCSISQPSLSKSIKKLELEMGGALVRREREHTHLTEMGQMLLPQLEQALALADAARDVAQEFSRTSKSKLCLGVMCTIGPGRLIALVEHLAKKVPQLQLTLRDAPGAELLEMLTRGEIDVALIGLSDYPTTVETHALYNEKFVIAFPPEHEFARHDVVPVSELSGVDYLERTNCEFDFLYQTGFEKGPFDLEPRFSSDNEEWIQAMVVAGLGCTMLPEHSVVLPHLQTRRIVEPELSRDISIVTMRGRKHSKSVEAFSRLCRCLKWD